MNISNKKSSFSTNIFNNKKPNTFEGMKKLLNLSPPKSYPEKLLDWFNGMSLSGKLQFVGIFIFVVFYILQYTIIDFLKTVLVIIVVYYIIRATTPAVVSTHTKGLQYVFGNQNVANALGGSLCDKKVNWSNMSGSFVEMAYDPLKVVGILILVGLVLSVIYTSITIAFKKNKKPTKITESERKNLMKSSNIEDEDVDTSINMLKSSSNSEIIPTGNGFNKNSTSVFGN
jgi:hypothetical protein